MTAAELNQRVKTYRGWIVLWEERLEQGGPESLRDDIRELNAWISQMVGPRDNIDFKSRRRVARNATK